MKFQNAAQEHSRGELIVKRNKVLAFTEEAATISAEQYAKLRKQGRPLEDIDKLIDGNVFKLLSLSGTFEL